MTTISEGALEPVQGRERIAALDILRGVALFGILVVNITHYLDWFAPYTSHADETAEWLVGVFATDKFYPLFSFLFGVGFAIQLTRANDRGGPFLRVYLRRLVVLLLMGVAFFVFVERESILISYALLGAPLLLFRNRSPKALLVWAVVLLAIHPVYRSIQLALREASPVEGTAQASAATERTARVALEEATIAGNYPAVAAARARLFPLSFAVLPFFNYALRIFSMFLLGFYAHRRGVFSNLDASRQFVRQTLWWSVGIWVVVTLAVQAVPGQTMRAQPWLRAATYDVSAVALTISYMVATLSLLRWELPRRLLSLLGWTGRMGLTNYVLHFVIVTTIFCGYGFGLYDGLGQSMGPVLAVLITLVPIPLSVWWLRRFRFGPLEWLWRSLTYGRRQPMRIAPAARSTARVPYLRAAVAAMVLLATGVTAAVRVTPERRRGDEAQIAKLEGEWRQALLSADTVALARIATTGYQARGTSGETTTLPQLMDSIASGALRFDAITQGSSTIVTHENTASASGHESQALFTRGGTGGGDRRYVRWYVKRDGQWRLAYSYLARPS